MNKRPDPIIRPEDFHLINEMKIYLSIGSTAVKKLPPAEKIKEEILTAKFNDKSNLDAQLNE